MQRGVSTPEATMSMIPQSGVDLTGSGRTPQDAMRRKPAVTGGNPNTQDPSALPAKALPQAVAAGAGTVVRGPGARVSAALARRAGQQLKPVLDAAGRVVRWAVAGAAFEQGAEVVSNLVGGSANGAPAEQGVERPGAALPARAEAGPGRLGALDRSMDEVYTSNPSQDYTGYSPTVQTDIESARHSDGGSICLSSETIGAIRDVQRVLGLSEALTLDLLDALEVITVTSRYGRRAQIEVARRLKEY